MTIKTDLIAKLDELAEVNGPLLKVKRGDNHGPVLGQIFIWQEMAAYAEKQLKEAWKGAQEEGLIPPDDEMRATAGETIVVESDKFSCIAKVTAARDNFVKEDYIAAVAKKFKIPVEKLNALIKGATKDGKAPLSKKILEA